MILSVNTVIKRIVNSKNIIERILWVDQNNEMAFLIDIYSNTWPYAKTIKDISEALDSGECEVIKDPLVRIVNENNISGNGKDMRDKAFKTIEFVLNIVPEPDIYYSDRRVMAIDNTSKALLISESTLKRYLKKYWKNGKCKNALLPDYYMCGTSHNRKVGEQKLGRPKKYSKIVGEGINVDDEIKRVFRLSIDKYYYNKRKNSLKTVYNLMIRHYFSEDFKIEQGVKIPLIKPVCKIPSMQQFRYWFNKERNYKAEISYREGYKNYQLNHRAILGNSTYECNSPGVYQIDCTSADVYLVSRYNRSWIIGRPTVYYMIDVFSRVITSVYIGLESGSWIGMAMAITNAVIDKVEFCREYGIEISQEQWPTHHLPSEILGDRGELEGTNILRFINSFNVKIGNSSSYRGDMKAVIERYFRTTHQIIKPLLPGSIDSNFHERGAKDYRLDAKLDIYEFSQVILHMVIQHNNKDELLNYRLDEDMIKDNVRPVPIELWNWGIKNRSGKLRIVDENILKLSLMPEDTAYVRANGVSFKTLLYVSDNAIKNKWFERARNEGGWRITVSYDPRNMNYIYLKSQDGKNYEKFYLLEHQERYFCKTLDEIMYLIQKEKLDNELNIREKLQNNTDLMSKIDNIVNQAIIETKKQQDGDMSNKKMIEGIKLNRKNEKRLNRQNEAFFLDDEVEDVKINKNLNDSTSIVDTIMENDNAILMKKQRGRLNECYNQNISTEWE